MKKWEVCLITHLSAQDPDKVRAQVDYSTGSRRAVEGKDANLAVLLASLYEDGWDFIATTPAGNATYWAFRRPYQPTPEERKSEGDEAFQRHWEGMDPEVKKQMLEILERQRGKGPAS